MYGKAFAEMYRGSMFGAGPDVFAVWGYVVANTVGSSVELHPTYLSGCLGMSEGRVNDAIEWLMRDDPKSRTEAESGRRLVPEGRFQYFVPSWQKWHDIHDEEDRRAKNRAHQAAFRERKKKGLTPLTCKPKSAKSAQEEAEEESEEEEKTEAPPDRERAGARVVVAVSSIEAPEAEPDPGMGTMCPADLASRLEANETANRLAERLQVPLAVVIDELRAFESFWVLGKGAGQKRTGWAAKARQWVIDQHRRPGGLKAPGLVEHNGRHPVNDVERQTAHLLATLK